MDKEMRFKVESEIDEKEIESEIKKKRIDFLNKKSSPHWRAL